MAVSQRNMRWLLTLALTAGVDLVAAQSTEPPCLAEYESTMEAAVKGSVSDAEFTGKVRQALDRQRDLTRLVGSNCKESTSVLKDYGQQLEKAEKEYEPWRKWPGRPLSEQRRYHVAWAKYKICLMERFNQAVCAVGPSTNKAAGVKGDPTPTPGRAIVPAPKRAVAAANPPERLASPSSLSAMQIASCSEEIKRTQIDSQSWTGDVNDVAARLGRFQKNLFEGRCAAHPEAQAYIAGANKMLAHGGNPSRVGGASLPPLASSGNAARSDAPDAGRTRKVHNPAADAKSCTQLKVDKDRHGADISGRWQFVNNCPTAVEFFWCSVAECERGSGNTWTIRPGWGWPVAGPDVRWGACRGANSGGFDKGTAGQRYTCPNLTWQ